MEIYKVIPIQEERDILHLPWSLALDPEQIGPYVNVILFHVPGWFFNLIRIQALPREKKYIRGDMIMKECLQTSGRAFFSFYLLKAQILTNSRFTPADLQYNKNQPNKTQTSPGAI